MDGLNEKRRAPGLFDYVMLPTMPLSPWLSTDPPSCYAALRQDAQELLAALPHLNQREWERRLRTLFNGDPVLGPLATAWMLSQALKASSKEDAPFWQSQISACKRTAQISHKSGQRGLGYDPV